MDNGTGKVLGNVPYFHQCDNETVDGPKSDDNRVYGDVMCQLTSLAMVLASKGIKPKDSSKQVEDLLYKIAKAEDGEFIILRVDSTIKRIWQHGEMDIYITTAKVLEMLYNSGRLVLE